MAASILNGLRLAALSGTGLLALAGCRGESTPVTEESEVSGNAAVPAEQSSVPTAIPPPDNEASPAPPTNAAEPQQPPVAAYRAVGNEPGWSLTIGATEMNYVGDYGEVKITQPAPKPMVDRNRTTYRTPRLMVVIVRATCSDGMSEYVYADNVRLTADGKRVEGCGGKRTLPPGASAP